jgi:tetratricopeptide (TPR) repeat protein
MSESSRDGAKKEAKAEISLAIPSWIVLVLLALTPPAFATGFSNYELLKELVLTGGVGLALLIWGIQAVRARAVSMMAGRVTVLVLAFGLYALAASLWADNQLLGLWDSLHFVALAGVVLIVTSPVGRPLRFYDFAVATGVGAALASVFGFLDLAGIGLFTIVWDPPGPTGAFDAMEFASAYYAVALPVLLGATFRFPSKSRIFFGVCFALAGFHFALVSSWAWAAVFAGACVLAALIVIAFQRTEAVMVLWPVMVLLGVVAVFVAIAQWGMPQPERTSPATSLPRLVQTGAADPRKMGGEVRNTVFAPDRWESVTSSRAHSYLLAVGTDLFSEKPIIGHGAGSWWPLQTESPNIDHPFVESMFAHYPAFRTPHNGVTKLLVEYGVVGLALFVLWLMATFAVTLGALARRTERTGWIVEHWALLTAALAGLAFMFFTPLIELAPAALTWVAGLAVLTRFSASLNDFRGWSSVWAARSGREGGFASNSNLAGALAALVGLGVLVPTVLNFAAGYYRGQADQYMLRTLYPDAVQAYRAAGQWYPAFGDVPYNIALAYEREGKLEKNQEMIELAVDLRPYDVRALALYGRAELGDKDKSKAIRLGKRAVDAYPNSVEARKLLVAALDVGSRYEEAVEQALEMLEREPPRDDRAQLHMMTADLYLDMLKRPADAKKHYERAYNLIENPQQRAKLKDKLKGIDTLIENQRRMREGKPPLPVPGKGGHEGHGH